MISTLREIESKFMDDANNNDTNMNNNEFVENNENTYANVIDQKDDEGNLREVNFDEEKNQLIENNYENEQNRSNNDLNISKKSGISKHNQEVDNPNSIDDNEGLATKEKYQILNSKQSAKSNHKTENSNLENSKISGSNFDKFNEIRKSEGNKSNK